MEVNSIFSRFEHGMITEGCVEIMGGLSRRHGQLTVDAEASPQLTRCISVKQDFGRGFGARERLESDQQMSRRAAGD